MQGLFALHRILEAGDILLSNEGMRGYHRNGYTWGRSGQYASAVDP